MTAVVFLRKSIRCNSIFVHCVLAILDPPFVIELVKTY